MLGKTGRGWGAAVRGHAGRWSHSAGYQRQGGVVEERSEKTCHFLQLLTDSSYLTGEDAHLKRGSETEESRMLGVCRKLLTRGFFFTNLGYCDA